MGTEDKFPNSQLLVTPPKQCAATILSKHHGLNTLTTSAMIIKPRLQSTALIRSIYGIQPLDIVQLLVFRRKEPQQIAVGYYLLRQNFMPHEARLQRLLPEVEQVILMSEQLLDISEV